MKAEMDSLQDPNIPLNTDTQNLNQLNNNVYQPTTQEYHSDDESSSSPHIQR